MNHYAFADRFRTLYQQAVASYRSGKRGADAFFNAEDRTWLASNGITPQHLYDYAEDDVNDGEPGYDRALGIESIRRDYFLNVQGGRPSGVVLDESTLPPKSAAVRNITWLPRIIPKARAKLRGELPASLMYSCGGDRHFFKTHDIHTTEFLNLVWRAGLNEAMIVDWVAQRSAARLA